MKAYACLIITYWIVFVKCRDEEKISKVITKRIKEAKLFSKSQILKSANACYWPNEVYEPCFGGCAEISCDNPRNHLRPCYPYCEPGCVCEEPYVRDDRTHQCVLPQDCSPTQMGIPVPSRRTPKPPAPPKPSERIQRTHNKKEENLELSDDENLPNHVDEFKRAAEVSRMGNYFNIVIAPPPIKALQPRKLIQHDAQRMKSNAKY